MLKTVVSYISKYADGVIKALGLYTGKPLN